MRLVQDADVKNKKVFLRVDFNVPINEGVISDNYRIKTALPTIQYLVERKAKVIIGTHFGRPEGQKSTETSLALIAKELEKLLGSSVTLAPDVLGGSVSQMVDALESGQVMMLENLRWDAREEKDDAGFAQELGGLAEIYVNDAFAVSHRANASVHTITKFLPSYAGLLMQSEITNLTFLLTNPEPPFVLIVGGVKVDDKAGMIDKLAPKADTILVGGGVANTFLKAKGIDIGESVYDEKMVPECERMLNDYSIKIVLPIDAAKEPTASGSFKILDLGPETISKFVTEIKKAKTVLWNGSLGKNEEPLYQKGMTAIAQAMGGLNEKTVIAGGDTVGFILEHGLEKGISFLSTGGGAALEYLAGEKLPGIEVLG